jgi:hypothetical protein
VVSSRFGLSVNSVIWTFRIAVFVVPVLSGVVAYKLCTELRNRDGPVPAEPPTLAADGQPELADTTAG